MPVAAQSVPPLGPRVVGLNTPAQTHMLLYDLDLGYARQVVLGEGAHTLWGFAPDGCTLLATLDDTLVSARLDGTATQTLLSPSAGRPYEPSWSSDGTQIVLTLRQGAGEEATSTIVTLPAEGGAPRPISATGQESTPRWSPDGTRIAYVSYEQRAAGADLFATAVPTTAPADGQELPAPTLVNEADLWVADALSGERTRLTDFATGSVSMPRWSPDGSLIAFVYAPAPNQDLLWIIASQSGAIPTQLSFDYTTALDMTWQPEGTHLIASLMGLQGMAENRLWQIPLAGRAEQDALLYMAFYDLSGADYPRFSADGTVLAARTAYALSLIDMQTATQTLLSDAWALGNTPPIWMPASFQGEADCNR